MSCPDFKIVQNNDRDLIITVLDPDTGSVIDLTGAQAITIAMFPEHSDTAVFTKTLGSGIALTTPASGIITLSIADTDIDDIVGRYRFDGKVTDSNGKTYNLRRDDYDFVKAEILESLV